uniref:Uncharacterized protein n=1 Tax=Salix viminalis TaxID=40686 RepID=A0A6N2KJY5_SALVM
MKLFRQPFNSQLDIASSSWLPSTDPSSRHPINDFEPSLNTASPLPAFPQLIDLVTECCKQPDEEHTVAASTKIQRQSMINEAKPDFEAKLERLKKLSEMEAEKEIIKKCQEGEMSLRQGLMLAKKAQELLRSAPDEGLFSA